MGLRVGAALLGALMLSESAFALSCARPNLEQVVEEAKASPKIYYVLAGRFTPETQTSRRAGYNPSENRNFSDKRKAVTRTVFEGFSLAPSRAADRDLTRFLVDIETSCAGPWCSGVPDASQELIAFVEAREGEPPILKIGACPKFVYPAKPETVETVRTCLEKSCAAGVPY